MTDAEWKHGYEEFTAIEEATRDHRLDCQCADCKRFMELGDVAPGAARLVASSRYRREAQDGETLSFDGCRKRASKNRTSV